MKTILIGLWVISSLSAQETSLVSLHVKSLESEVVRLRTVIDVLSAQLNAMRAEQKANEAKDAEKAAIEKRSKELGCEIEPSTGDCKKAQPKPDTPAK